MGQTIISKKHSVKATKPNATAKCYSSYMNDTWVKKNGYETLLLANDKDLNLPQTEAQVVRFHQGKFAHYHKVKTEFFYITSGEGSVILDGKEISLKKGSSLLVQPGMNHEFINKSDVPLEAVMFKTNSTPEDTYFEA